MNVESSNNFNVGANDALRPPPPQRNRAETTEAKSESGSVVSLENHQALVDKLKALPEVRPEMVARGKALVADSNFPSADVLDSVASALVNSGDV